MKFTRDGGGDPNTFNKFSPRPFNPNQTPFNPNQTHRGNYRGRGGNFSGPNRGRGGNFSGPNRGRGGGFSGPNRGRGGGFSGPNRGRGGGGFSGPNKDSGHSGRGRGGAAFSHKPQNKPFVPRHTSAPFHRTPAVQVGAQVTLDYDKISAAPTTPFNPQEVWLQFKPEALEPLETTPQLDARTIHVKNISLITDLEGLTTFFRSFGEVETVRVMGVSAAETVNLPAMQLAIEGAVHPERNSFTAYVRFEDEATARKATSVNGFLFKGHHLGVTIRGEEAKKVEGGSSVFVENISFDAEEEEVWRVLEVCGPISGVTITRNNKTNTARVDFCNSASVQTALNIENATLRGRKLKISTNSSPKQGNNDDDDEEDSSEEAEDSDIAEPVAKKAKKQGADDIKKALMTAAQKRLSVPAEAANESDDDDDDDSASVKEDDDDDSSEDEVAPALNVSNKSANGKKNKNSLAPKSPAQKGGTPAAKGSAKKNNKASPGNKKFSK